MIVGQGENLGSTFGKMMQETFHWEQLYSLNQVFKRIVIDFFLI